MQLTLNPDQSARFESFPRRAVDDLAQLQAAGVALLPSLGVPLEVWTGNISRNDAGAIVVELRDVVEHDLFVDGELVILNEPEAA